jgi:hypothetical protein
MSGDDLQRHLSYTPCLIGSSTDYSSSCTVLPGIQESSHGPNSWPVATHTSREPIDDGVSRGSSKRDQQFVIRVLSIEYADTSRDDRCQPPTAALRLYTPARSHSPITSHVATFLQTFIWSHPSRITGTRIVAAGSHATSEGSASIPGTRMELPRSYAVIHGWLRSDSTVRLHALVIMSASPGSVAVPWEDVRQGQAEITNTREPSIGCPAPNDSARRLDRDRHL